MAQALLFVLPPRRGIIKHDELVVLQASQDGVRPRPSRVLAGLEVGAREALELGVLAGAEGQGVGEGAAAGEAVVADGAHFVYVVLCLFLFFFVVGGGLMRG